MEQLDYNTTISLVFLAIAFVVARRLPRWMAGVPFLLPEDAKKQLDNETDTVVIDLRTSGQFARPPGHIEGAMNVSLIELMGKIRQIKPELPVHSNVPVMLVCHNGQLSARAARMLRKGGLTKVSVLDGGLKAWNKAGLPLVGSTSTS